MTEPEQGADAPKPEDEGAPPSEPSPTPDAPAAADPPANDAEKPLAPGHAEPEKGDTLFGIKVHNLIFVGMILGIFLGLVTYYGLDHHDTLVLKAGTTDVAGEAVSEVQGKISLQGDTYVVTDPGGVEHRYAKSQVEEVKKAKETSSGQTYVYAVWFYNFFGKTIFMRLLKMIIAPLIFASIVAGIVSLAGLDQLKRIGLKTMAYYVCTTLIAVTIGLVMVLMIAPGKKDASQKIRKQRDAKYTQRAIEYQKQTGEPSTKDGKATPKYLEWLSAAEARDAGTGHEAKRFQKIAGAKGTSARDIMKEKLVSPMLTNPFESLTFGRSLGIIFFALLFGVAIVVVGPIGKPVAAFFVGLNEVILQLTKWIMSLAPFCVMCIVAELIATEGPGVFATLAWYCITVIVGIGVHVCVLIAIAHFIGRCNPLRLWQGLREALMIAFTTRSSAATLPVTMRCVNNNLKVSPQVSNFALPVGATMNMDGTALYEGVAVIFMIQIYAGMVDVPIELGGAVTLVIFVTAVMASIGAAAVPDAGLVTMVLVAEAVGLPVYLIPLIFAVDAFLDMFRTTTNVLGDSVGCLVVNRLEGYDQEPAA